MTVYVGFWRRFWARMIDGLVLLPVGVMNYWFWSDSKLLVFVTALPLSLLSPAYLIILHGLRGQSFGKMALGLKVESIYGGRVAWSRLIVRFLPILLFELVWAIGVISSTHAMPDVTFQTATITQKSQLIIDSMPHWVRITINLYALWVVADVIVLIASSQKRAIHDLLSGTVVKRLEYRLSPVGGNAG